MAATVSGQPPTTRLPDHTQLPDSDGEFVKNFQEHPQSLLLTESLWPVLEAGRPDGQFAIGQDCGIYWRLTRPPEPPERGAVAPDWFLVLGVPPVLEGKPRRSYVLWQEYVPPLIVLEFVSGDGSEERDRTPWKGKYWIYENVIRPAYYGIYEVDAGSIEMHFLLKNHFEPMQPNTNDRFPIEELGVELGIWQGTFQNLELPWMRWWTSGGDLLPTGQERAEQEHERAEQEHERAEQEHERAEQEHERAERLATRLRSLGVDPDAEA